MSEPPNVLIAVGNTTEGEIPQLPQQNYKNIFTEINIVSFHTESDADFYNITIQAPSTKRVSDFYIYGFMPGNYKYTYDSSIQQVVDFFQRDDHIEIVVCDMLSINPLFNTYQYIHPHSLTNNIPFFIKKSIKNKIQFVNEKLLFQNQLNKLQQEGHIIFHIASPLISLVQS